jgi:hypothetical protein
VLQDVRVVLVSLLAWEGAICIGKACRYHSVIMINTKKRPMIGGLLTLSGAVSQFCADFPITGARGPQITCEIRLYGGID